MTTLTLPRGTTDRLVRQLTPCSWGPIGRAELLEHQIPPEGDWDVWILMGGRGSGKTEAGARYFAKWMQEHPGHRGRIIAPTLGDAFESCIDGPSGLRSVDPSVTVLPAAVGGSKVTWANGSEALVLGTYGPGDVERLRASGNRHIDWWEEAAANRQFAPAWDQADFGLRLGERPHSILTTTPRNVKKLRELLALPGTVVTRGTILDNPHLPESKRATLVARYAGTRVGRQELDGELLTDVPGALWSWGLIERAHSTLPTNTPDMQRVVVAIDPAVTSGESSDETGIVVAGLGVDGRGYVLDDRSCRMAPSKWARRSIVAFRDFEADRIVGEVNNGGDLVEEVLRSVDANIPYRKVHASRGKRVRAEPLASLYEQGRISHMQVFPELEGQMTSWDPAMDDSPDRVDALVWAFAELGLYAEPKRQWRIA